jgi:hypothetical protein
MHIFGQGLGVRKMATASRILVKTTIPPVADDWSVDRFSLLTRYLASLADEAGSPLYDVTAADRVETEAGDDADLQALAAGAFDQLWLIAVDTGGALTAADAAAVSAFRQRGGGVFLTRDHQDLGSCIARIEGLGPTQHFQSVNPEPDEARWRCDDRDTPEISWPNYHSGANGDLREIEVVEPQHPLMAGPRGAPIRRLPAHPHEGAVSVPPALEGIARLVARGRSTVTGASFGLCVAVDEPGRGRAISDSSFHHLANFNWDPRLGRPSFVTEQPGDEVLREPDALADVHGYVANAAAWLARRI